VDLLNADIVRVLDLGLDLQGMEPKLQDLLRYEYPVVINQFMTAAGYIKAYVSGPDKDNPEITSGFTVAVHRFVHQVSGVDTTEIADMIERYPYVNAKGHRKVEVKCRSRVCDGDHLIHPWLNGAPYALGCRHSWNVHAHFIRNGAKDWLFHDDTYEYHTVSKRVPIPDSLPSVPLGRTGVVRYGRRSNLLQRVKLSRVGTAMESDILEDEWDDEDEDEDEDIDISGESDIIYGYASEDDYFSDD
jgi:hypothetical protein